MKLGYLGPEGTFSYFVAAHLETSLGHDVELQAGASIPALFEHLSQGKVDMALVPVENSVEGSVTTTMDALVDLDGFTIQHEIIEPISHSLMAKKGTEPSSITTIISHPQPLGQCRHYLHSAFPGIPLEPRLSTAAASVEAAQKEGVGVIGHQHLAKLYNLDILETNIQDSKTNQTRFLLLSKEASPPSGKDKTSIVFSTGKDQPGSLVRILQLFSEAGINLTRIESRPTKLELGEYVFFVDCEGHQDEAPLSTVLEDVKSIALYFKALGSYKQGGAL
jgi:prephenate dehydratase